MLQSDQPYVAWNRRWTGWHIAGTLLVTVGVVAWRISQTYVYFETRKFSTWAMAVALFMAGFLWQARASLASQAKAPGVGLGAAAGLGLVFNLGWIAWEALNAGAPMWLSVLCVVGAASGLVLLVAAVFSGIALSEDEDGPFLMRCAGWSVASTVAVGIILIVALSAAPENAFDAGYSRAEAGLVSRLKTLQIIAANYEERHHNGYPGDARMLLYLEASRDSSECDVPFPPETGTIIGNGHQLTLVRGPEVVAAAGCRQPGVSTFQLVVRPIKYEPGDLSCLIEPEGPLRCTRDDRPATRDDPGPGRR